jgi:hypothetical protein
MGITVELIVAAWNITILRQAKARLGWILTLR